MVYNEVKYILNSSPLDGHTSSNLVYSEIYTGVWYYTDQVRQISTIECLESFFLEYL